MIQIFIRRLGKVSGKKSAALALSYGAGRSDLRKRDLFSVIFLNKSGHVFYNCQILTLPLSFRAVRRCMFQQQRPDQGEGRQGAQRSGMGIPVPVQKTKPGQNLLLPGSCRCLLRAKQQIRRPAVLNQWRHKIIFVRKYRAQQHGMEEQAQEAAFLSVIRKARMHLPRIDENPFSFFQIHDFSIYIIFHPA